MPILIMPSFKMFRWNLDSHKIIKSPKNYVLWWLQIRTDLSWKYSDSIRKVSVVTQGYFWLWRQFCAQLWAVDLITSSKVGAEQQKNSAWAIINAGINEWVETLLSSRFFPAPQALCKQEVGDSFMYFCCVKE